MRKKEIKKAGDIFLTFDAVTDNEKKRIALYEIKKRSHKGIREDNATTLIVDAFENYDPKQSEADYIYKGIGKECKFFINRFNITQREDFLDVIKNELPYPIEDVKLAKKRISFDLSNKRENKIYKELLQIKPRDRGALAIEAILRYLIDTDDNKYFTGVTDRLLSKLQALNKKGEEEELNELIDMIYSFKKM